MPVFRKSDANMLRTAYELSAGLLSFIVAIVIGWWFGRVLDGWLGIDSKAVLGQKFEAADVLKA